jgi:arsenate reductase
MSRKAKILFFSTGNAARCRMAQGFFRRMIGDQMIGASTAEEPAHDDPLVVEVMREVGIDISNQPATPVAQSLKEHFVCVVTLSDDAKERSPIWPFTLNLFHWNVMDPAAVDGPTEQRREVFRQVRDEIQRNVREFANTIAPQLRSATI